MIVFGHLVGDQVLKRVGTTLRKQLRPSDLLFRYGGEEFVVAINNTSLQQGSQTIQRLLQAIAEDAHAELKVTVSAGLSLGTRHESIDSAIKRADAACYQAKAAGRNRLVIDDSN